MIWFYSFMSWCIFRAHEVLLHTLDPVQSCTVIVTLQPDVWTAVTCCVQNMLNTIQNQSLYTTWAFTMGADFSIKIAVAATASKQAGIPCTSGGGLETEKATGHWWEPCFWTKRREVKSPVSCRFRQKKGKLQSVKPRPDTDVRAVFKSHSVGWIWIRLGAQFRMARQCPLLCRWKSNVSNN